MEQKQKIIEILIAAANEFTSIAANKIMKAAKGEITTEIVETFDTTEKRALFYAERLIENGAVLLPCEEQNRLTQLQGKITIGLINSNNPKFNNQFNIRIEDENYNLFTELYISPANLALAISGQAYRECKIVSYQKNFIERQGNSNEQS